MQITYYFRTSILVLACILPAFTPALASGASTVPDSLLTEKYIRSIYISAPDSALHLLDEAEKRRLPSMPAFHIDILRSMVYESQAMYVLKERCLRRALQSDSVRLVPARRLRLLSQLSSTLDRLNRYEEGISITSEALQTATVTVPQAITAYELKGITRADITLSGTRDRRHTLLLPQTITAGQPLLRLTIGGQTYRLDATARNGAFEAGKSYTLNVTVSNAEITATVSINPWLTGGDSEGDAGMEI
ncbi:fimbrillin family protein [Bacteroides cellulosilyticus]|uniref:fimbrillin family protein n=1 Tax=Bacteroides cellulosilyticus TaxID=246787 RepID=UPI001C37C1DF|nr:fimbrillin family protein [Bacteroides cellulosilyticus]MBV3637426.1 fimbrillin family protein [Bacteroides cellulosilyticus]MBV3663767.1 fimbrillin family protein [Bacteroides cellulosilyticus]MBV3685758.1 fimbrillin family protein [Bacteroides cellulosilyticus]MBV3694440.1 fimbrillin family protein [Bacteroides cellulosilyticus]MBV3707966.1 fimbrillin family protein [Bacteroides cellulosilyticus]